MSTIEVKNLHTKFRELEQECVNLSDFPEKSYPAIRMDGIKHSKQFLKNYLKNLPYNIAVEKSIIALHKSTRKMFDRNFADNWVFGCAAADELSIFFGNSLTNPRYNRRMMKVCTTLSGNMSSILTSYIRVKQKKVFSTEVPHKNNSSWIPQIASYDCRPLYFCSVSEMASYIRYRYIVASRYSYWKVLKLQGCEEFRDDGIRDDIDLLKDLVVKRGWQDDYRQAISAFSLFYPDGNGGLLFKRPVDEEDMTLENLTLLIDQSLCKLKYEL